MWSLTRSHHFHTDGNEYNSALDVDTTGIQRATDAPLSREDALAKRLRTLRNQREQQADYQKATRNLLSTEDPPPPYTARETEAPSKPSLGSSPSPPSATPSTAHGQPGATRHDHLHVDTDDKTLDEILDSLVIEDDHWSVSDDDQDPENAKQVEELLAKLRDDPGTSILPSPPGRKPGGDQENKDDDDDDDEDDNSEGDVMTKEVNQILSRTLDELNLDPASTEEDKEDATSYPDPEISLPTVPQDTTTASPPDDNNNNNTDSDTNLPDLPATPHDFKDSTTTDLTLPTVPTALHDPAPPNTNTSSTSTDPFESSIANRLAALKGPGHKPLVTDALGLPSAPTSQPADVPGGLLRPRSGYTDADQKTWCVVCLEDGTIRCLDCEDGGEVYCARCWREMHVGPAAGYDERGHQWEKFDPRALRR